MSANNFKMKKGANLQPIDLATLVSPQAGDIACDINDSNKIKRYDSVSSAWVELGAGGGTTDVDTIFVQNFESAKIADFTQSGMTLSTVNPIDQTVSAVLNTKVAAQTYMGQTIDIYPAFRGNSVTFSFRMQTCIPSSPSSYLTLTIKDQSAATVYTTAVDYTTYTASSISIGAGSDTLTGFTAQFLANIQVGALLEASPFLVPVKVLAVNTGLGTIKVSATALSAASGLTVNVGQIPTDKFYTFDIPLNCTQLSYELRTTDLSVYSTIIDDIALRVNFGIDVVTQVEPDSCIRLSGANGFGSTATSTRRFLNIHQNLGSAIQYVNSPTLGGQFIAQEDGIYNISYSEQSNANTTQMYVIIRLNGVSIAVDNQVYNTATTAYKCASVSTSSYLKKGDIITAEVSPTPAENNGVDVFFTMSKVGSTKVLKAAPDSKVKIPTSEVRFTGASTRGTGDGGQRIKFDTIDTITGSAFEITNDATGTSVKILKDGIIGVSSSLNSPNTFFLIFVSKNSVPVAADSVTISGGYTSATWEGKVAKGDIFSIKSAANPATNILNSFSILHQETEVAVAVPNILPQWSEGDTCLRLSGANGFGSTATTTRRFANVLQNIGSDVQYVDSPTLGGQFIALKAGIYNVSYSERSVSNIPYSTIYITLNGTAVSNNGVVYNTANADSKYNNVSWQGYLNVGDIICPVVGAASQNSGTDVYFTISKVGKPNITGVDVTPFANVNTVNLSEWKDGGAIQIGSTGTAPTKGGGAGAADYTKYRQVGEDWEVVYKYYQANAGVTGTGDYLFSLPAGLVFDDSIPRITAAMPTHTSNFYDLSDGAGFSDRGQYSTYPPKIVPYDSTRFRVFAPYWGSGSGSGTIGAAAAQLGNADTSYNFNFKFKGKGLTATSPQVLIANDTFSTDSANLAYSSTYNLTTLASAPVGTFITYTYAANTNTRVQTSTAPTQSVSDMNANGIQIFTRAYNAASTAASPACVAIQIGKGMKGVTNNLYKSTGKATSGVVDFTLLSTTHVSGLFYKDYNESSGILIMDAGIDPSAATTTRTLNFSDITAQSNGYLVINASKSPALTGVTLPKRYIVNSFQSGTDWWEVYNDGWVRQGGFINSGLVTRSLLITMGNADYGIQITAQSEGTTSYVYQPRIRNATTASQIVAYIDVDTARNRLVVEGYGDSAAVKALGAKPTY